MKKFNVTFARFGSVEIEAENEDDAFRKVEGYGTEDVEWSDDFVVTDADEKETDD